MTFSSDFIDGIARSDHTCWELNSIIFQSLPIVIPSHSEDLVKILAWIEMRC
jgi:hypothetical protein